jgi:hypothetical protein
MLTMSCLGDLHVGEGSCRVTWMELEYESKYRLGFRGVEHDSCISLVQNAFEPIARRGRRPRVALRVDKSESPPRKSSMMSGGTASCLLRFHCAIDMAQRNVKPGQLESLDAISRTRPERMSRNLVVHRLVHGQLGRSHGGKLRRIYYYWRMHRACRCETGRQLEPYVGSLFRPRFRLPLHAAKHQYRR